MIDLPVITLISSSFKNCFIANIWLTLDDILGHNCDASEIKFGKPLKFFEITPLTLQFEMRLQICNYSINNYNPICMLFEVARQTCNYFSVYFTDKWCNFFVFVHMFLFEVKIHARWKQSIYNSIESGTVSFNTSSIASLNILNIKMNEMKFNVSCWKIFIIQWTRLRRSIVAIYGS